MSPNTEFTVALLVCAFAVSHWTSSGAATLLLLLGLSAAAGTMKVVLPGIQGNLSASFLFIMWGIVRMSLGETLLMGWSSSLIQSYWKYQKKPRPIQVLFNLSLISVSVGAGSAFFKAPFMHEMMPNPVFRMLLAAVTYFAVNTCSVSGVIGLSERQSVWNVWRSSYIWTLPHYLMSASLVSGFEYLNKILGIQVTVLVLPPAYLMYHMFAMHITRLRDAVELAKQQQRHAEETANLHLRTIRSLALAIEAKDKTTAEHLHRVQTYAMGLAEACGLPPEEMEALRAAAILHDVGKIAVPEQIISKPGKLTPEEFAKMKIHTVVGGDIVTNADFPFAVAPLVRAHHEKWDGSGYPDGLKGEEIPLGARILAAVDCLDALASDRQYRKALPLDKAMSIVVAESGKSFDPSVVRALQEHYYELENLARSTFQQDLMKLSIEATVDRGFAPDAGYAAGSLTSDSRHSTNCEQVLRELSILESMNHQIGQCESIQDDLLAIEPKLRELIPFDSLALYRRRGDLIECVFARGEAAPLLLDLVIKSGVGASGWTVANRTPLLNGNAVTEFTLVDEDQLGSGLASSLSIPLESESGPIGVLTLYSRQRDAFQASHLRVLLAISSKLAYQMNLESLGLAGATFDARVGGQLGELSEALKGGVLATTARKPRRQEAVSDIGPMIS